MTIPTLMVRITAPRPALDVDNPTVLIWSIPTTLKLRRETLRILRSRNPTVLIWSIPTNWQVGSGHSSHDIEVAIPPY